MEGMAGGGWKALKVEGGMMEEGRRKVEGERCKVEGERWNNEERKVEGEVRRWKVKDEG